MKRPAQYLLGLLAILLAGFALYGWLTLSYAYADGERAGTLQKLSRKGWLCKTYEGELALYVVAGVQPEIWSFTVRDEAAAQALTAVVGQRVQLHYTEHPGIPSSCFGDTRYFVDRLTLIGDAPVLGARPPGS
jgi:hypothetical protein